MVTISVIVLLLFTASISTATPLKQGSRQSKGVPIINPIPSLDPTVAADMILYNGKILTVDKDFCIAEAVAIRDGKFIVVGTHNDVRKLAGPSTELINLYGKTVVPGLIDSHLHQLSAAQNLNLVQLYNAKTMADVVKAIEEKVAAIEPGEWVISSSNWHESLLEEGRLPTKWDLDPVSPSNPVVIKRGGHVVAANSYALQLAGITKDTSDPEGGVIVRNESGEPTGVLFEKATYLVNQLVPTVNYDEKVQLLQDMMGELNSYGITGVTEPGLKGEDILAYYDIWGKNNMTVRTSVLYRLNNLNDVKFATSAYTPGFGDNMLNIAGLKYLADGGVEGGYLKDPYQIVPGEQLDPNYRGKLLMPPGGMPEFDEMMNLAAAKGWQVQVHVVGDAAVEAVVDSFERANNNTPIKDLRWALMHIFLPSPENINKMKDIGIIATAQDHPLLLGYNQVRYWGMDRAANAIPIRTLLDNGIMVGGGTDAPVLPWNPFLSIWWMATRGTLTSGTLGPDEAISREEALYLYTMGSAYTQFKENKVGSIEAGKLADLVVLSDDILTVPDEKLKDLQALTTIVGGKVVFQRN